LGFDNMIGVKLVIKGLCSQCISPVISIFWRVSQQNGFNAV